jgi:hypothetical protein
VGIKESFQVPLQSVHCDRKSLILRPFEGIEPGPVQRQVDRLEDVKAYRRTGRCEDEGWIAQVSSPSRFAQRAVDVPLYPAPVKPIQMVRIRAPRCEAACLVQVKIARDAPRLLGFAI